MAEEASGEAVVQAQETEEAKSEGAAAEGDAGGKENGGKLGPPSGELPPAEDGEKAVPGDEKPQVTPASEKKAPPVEEEEEVKEKAPPVEQEEVKEEAPLVGEQSKVSLLEEKVIRQVEVRHGRRV